MLFGRKPKPSLVYNTRQVLRLFDFVDSSEKRYKLQDLMAFKKGIGFGDKL